MTENLDPTPADRYSLDRLGAGDLEILKLVLTGGSVIDWKRLHFRTKDEVDAFLRANLFDPDDPIDVRRMYAILGQAVIYLRKTFRYKVAQPVAQPERIQDLFLMASGVMEPVRLRRIACVVLKVMHTLQHVESRELLLRTRMSEVELQQIVDVRVREVMDKVGPSLGMVSLEGSTKSRESIITKLISKKEHLAAQVFDRLRYRIVVDSYEQLPSMVLALASELFPYNFLVPGQTQNSLVPWHDLPEIFPQLSRLGHPTPDAQEDQELEHARNEFSGREYRILNFIVNLPARIDATALANRRKNDVDLGRIVFVPIEFQVLDVVTRDNNESGENSHARYKKRQLLRVLARLSRGLVVPRRRRSVRDDAPGTPPVAR